MDKVIMTDGDAFFAVSESVANIVIDFQNGIKPAGYEHESYYFNGQYPGIRFRTGEGLYHRLFAFSPNFPLPASEKIVWTIRDDIEFGEPIPYPHL